MPTNSKNFMRMLTMRRIDSTCHAVELNSSIAGWNYREWAQVQTCDPTPGFLVGQIGKQQVRGQVNVMSTFICLSWRNKTIRLLTTSS